MPKPSHLGPEYAAQFQDASVVAAYARRPPYPPETFALLARQVPADCRRLLDVGCGTGDLALGLAPDVEHVDAVDASAAMLAVARARPNAGGRVAWIHGAAETAPLSPPYGLVTAGESLHWMEWKVVLPRLRAALCPAGRIAIVGRIESVEAWTGPLMALIGTYSTNRQYRPYNLVDLLAADGLLHVDEVLRTEAAPVRMPVDRYVESMHSRNGFSRDRMDPARAEAFDAAAAALLAAHARGGELAFGVYASITLGR